MSSDIVLKLNCFPGWYPLASRMLTTTFIPDQAAVGVVLVVHGAGPDVLPATSVNARVRLGFHQPDPRGEPAPPPTSKVPATENRPQSVIRIHMLHPAG